MLTPRKSRPDSRRAPTDPAELAKLPKGRCKNCWKFFPKTRSNKQFCSRACKDEFREHGSAFGPLKQRLTKLIEKASKEAAARQFSEYAVTLAASSEFRRQLAAAGFVHRSQLKKRPLENTPEALRGSIDVTSRLLGVAIKEQNRITISLQSIMAEMDKRISAIEAELEPCPV